MSEVELPGVQERIFCGSGTGMSSSSGSSPSELSLLKSNENGLNVEHVEFVEQASSSSRMMMSLGITVMVIPFLMKL